jgi:hypothetical protein
MSTGATAGGFLHRDRWLSQRPAPAGPPAWRPVLCSVVGGGMQQARRPLQLAAVGAGAPPTPLPQDAAMRFEALQPGMVVNAQVHRVLDDGLRVIFCGYFEGKSRSWPT